MEYKYKPKAKEELLEAIDKEIKLQGVKADLNCIDTSAIAGMSELFGNVDSYFDEDGLSEFNGDISDWNVSNVRDMEMMFSYSVFNGDLSKWNVRNVRIMEKMFEGSKFLGDLSSWKVDKLAHTKDMFDSCRCTKPRWYKQ